MRKRTTYRRVRRRAAPSRSEGAFFKKGSQETFFGGGSEHDSFFKSTTMHGANDTIQRKCEKCEEEEKQVKRQPEKKEDEKKVMRAEDKKEEEKIQRAPEKKEEEKVMKKEEKKEEEKLQKKEGTQLGGGATNVSNYISSMSGKGESLSSSANQFFSSRMGYDFSNVRVHNDKEAADSAKAINAKAYAVGNNIVFNEGQYNIDSSKGKRLMAHELTHVVQQENDLMNKEVQRQVGPRPPVHTPPIPGQPTPAPTEPVPHFRDCVRRVTGIDNGDEVLFAAMNRAREFVTTAIESLDNPPLPGTVYETALATHFGDPITERRRRRLQTVYRRILGNLTRRNFICNRRVCDGNTLAQWDPSDDLIHICPPFWNITGISCRAIIIIHEAAHDAGIDIDVSPIPGVELHTPNRGQPGYPRLGAPPVRVRRSRRANTPDAYGFFSAHVHNGMDTPGTCSF